MNEGPPYFCTCGVQVDHEHDDCDQCLELLRTTDAGDPARLTGPIASFEEVFGPRTGDSSGPH